MSPELGLSIKKPVAIWNQPLKVNFKDLFKALGNAGVDAATQQWMGFGKDAVDVMAAVGLDSNKPAELAWALIYNSLVSAIADLISESNFLIQGVPENLDELCERLDLSLEDLELEITDHFFEHPERLPIVEAIKVPLQQWLEGFCIDSGLAEILSNRLPSYFVFALHNEWRKRPQDYERITDQIKTPFTDPSARIRGWQLYNAWLQKQIQEPMMFEAFGLDDIYVSLRGYFRQRKNENSKDKVVNFQQEYDAQEEFERIVIDLETELKGWLEKADKNDAIRVISGGPGSGKSSFAKIYAARLAKEGTYPVLFIPLHHFDPTDDLVKAVGEFVRYDQFLGENPLNPDDKNLRLLVIFDGLDELAMQGKIAKEVAQEFVREVQSKVSNFNRNKTRLQVLITGRDVAVQESFRDPGQILQVLPYFLPENQRKSENGEPYLDDQGLLGQDQRDEWWKRYGKASRQPFEAFPVELNRGNLTEITAQPLLNYLVALSYVQNKLTLSDTTNLNTVYADLLKAVYDRGYEGQRRHAAIGELSRDHFVRVLEEIALAAWHGDGRTTTVQEIEKHCENSGLQRLFENFEAGAKAGVTRLLAAFYFRQSGVRSNDKTFEFTHKSFGEYLTAKRIVRAMERIQKNFDLRREDMEEGWDEREALLHWAEVCGPTRLDTYLLQFLRDEVALKETKQVAQWQKTFAHLIEAMLSQGMPMEKIEPPLKFHRMNQWAINSEEALLVAMNACARVTQELSKVNWSSKEALGTWLKRLQGQRKGFEENVAAFLSLGFLDLSEQALHVIDFYASNLRETNLREADLVGADLENADLENADLENADLYGASLDGAYLEEANLRGANLKRASLVNANLENAYLGGANLENAYLVGANLEGANLARANLENAYLENADLGGANLEMANLEMANLLRANLEGANLEGANLEGADLEGAYLGSADLEKICWNRETRWENVRSLEEASNIPPKLLEQLKMNEK